MPEKKPINKPPFPIFLNSDMVLERYFKKTSVDTPTAYKAPHQKSTVQLSTSGDESSTNLIKTESGLRMTTAKIVIKSPFK